MTHTIQRVLAVFLLLLVVSCAQIPTSELAQYRNASAEVQKAAEDILIDFAAIKEASEAEIKRKDAASKPVEGPSPFSTELQHDGPAPPDAVTVRRTALRTIDTFNNTLATLAEGKSVETVQTAAGGAIEAANKFAAAAGAAAVAAPGLGALVGGVKTLVGELEKARLREEFDRAVRRGAPIIQLMLDELIAERKDHISLRAAEADTRQVKLTREITTQARTVIALFRDHSAPTGGVDPKDQIQTAMNAALQPVERILSSPIPTLAYGAGKPAFTEEHRVIALQSISQITERAAAINANTKQFERLRSALNAYGALLRQMQTALGALVTALDKPQTFDRISEDMFAIVFSLKKDIEAFRAARRGEN